VFPVGGVGVMLLGAVLAMLACGVLAAVLARRVGWRAAVAIAGFVWTLVVIALVTLIPAEGAPGIVPAESRLETCGEIGGPAPEGFWVFTSGQRLLNTVLFVPSGLLLVVAAARWPRWSVLVVPLGVGLLAAYSAGIEYIQFEVARIDRACDLTDVVDNVTGACVGVLLGVPLALVLRPWRSRR
jgi:glycopeptide antibiotics resistance protein